METVLDNGGTQMSTINSNHRIPVRTDDKGVAYYIEVKDLVKYLGAFGRYIVPSVLCPTSPSRRYVKIASKARQDTEGVAFAFLLTVIGGNEYTNMPSRNEISGCFHRSKFFISKETFFPKSDESKEIKLGYIITDSNIEIWAYTSSYNHNIIAYDSLFFLNLHSNESSDIMPVGFTII